MSVPASPRPWKVTREAATPFYVIVDANEKELARVCSYSDEHKPGSFQKAVDLDLAHSNAQLIVNVINQG